MRIAALMVALSIILVSMVGILATDGAMAVRRMYFATPGRFYAAGAVRLAMGLTLILAASISRWCRTVRALGAVMCLQAITAYVLGLERARAVMEWEAMRGTTALRAGAAIGLASGILVAFAFARRPPATKGRPLT